LAHSQLTEGESLEEHHRLRALFFCTNWGTTLVLFRPDAHNQSLIDANDKDLEEHCKKTIAGLQ
jgi:hypothetical protein